MRASVLEHAIVQDTRGRAEAGPRVTAPPADPSGEVESDGPPRVLVVIDDTPGGAAAARLAIELCRASGAHLTACRVLTGEPRASVRHAAFALLERCVRDGAPSARLHVSDANGRTVPEAILAIAERERAACIVVGANARAAMPGLIAVALREATTATVRVAVAGASALQEVS